MAPPKSRKGITKPSASITSRNDAKFRKTMMRFMRKLRSPVLNGERDEADKLIEAAFSRYPRHPYVYRLKAEKYFSLIKKNRGEQYSPADEELFREGFEAAIAACELAPKEIEFLDFLSSLVECKGARAVDRVRVAKLIRRGLKEKNWEVSGYDHDPDDFPSDSNKSIKQYQSILESALEVIEGHNTLELLEKKAELFDLISDFGEEGTLANLKVKLERFSEEASVFPRLVDIGSRYLAFVENQEQFSPGSEGAFVSEISQLCCSDPYELELQSEEEPPVPDAVLVQSTAEEQDSPFRDSIETPGSICVQDRSSVAVDVLRDGFGRDCFQCCRAGSSDAWIGELGGHQYSRFSSCGICNH